MSVTGKVVPRTLVAGGAEAVFSARSGRVTVTVAAEAMQLLSSLLSATVIGVDRQPRI